MELTNAAQDFTTLVSRKTADKNEMHFKQSV
jgi:hypothetical protein